MNQIITTPHSTLSITNQNTKKQKKNLLKLQFYIFSIILIFLCFYYIYFKYDLYTSEKISKKLMDNFSITSLYPNKSNYSVSQISKQISLPDNLHASVIGIIEIKKINIVYPILSDINKDLLKISPCKFYGTNPNEVGNLCIAGHNYKNNTFFSNLSSLNNGDIITIYDLHGSSINYIIYNIYTSPSNDFSCVNQNTSNEKVVTLITCDSFDNSYRTIVKAKEF